MVGLCWLMQILESKHHSQIVSLVTTSLTTTNLDLVMNFFVQLDGVNYTM